jgi:hypothetical protein
LPEWHRISTFVSYANQIGTARGPITGGLFLGSDASNDLTNTSQFPVSQDQRNTIRARTRFQPIRRMWFAVAGQYGSGLPADIGGEDPASLLAQFGPAILSRVNLARDRVRPIASIDIGGGLEVYRREQRSGNSNPIHKHGEPSERDQLRQYFLWDSHRAAAKCWSAPLGELLVHFQVGLMPFSPRPPV